MIYKIIKTSNKKIKIEVSVIKDGWYNVEIKKALSDFEQSLWDY